MPWGNWFGQEPRAVHEASAFDAGYYALEHPEDSHALNGTRHWLLLVRPTHLLEQCCHRRLRASFSAALLGVARLVVRLVV